MKSKTCIKCNKKKPIEYFVKYEKNTDGYRNTCKECYNLYQAIKRGSIIKPKPKEGYKICTKCGLEKPQTTEYFRADKSVKCGLRGQCKDCEKLYRTENSDIIKKYREENKEKLKKRARQYHLDNREKICKRSREYYKNNTEKANEINKNNYRKHITERKIYRHNSYIKNKESSRTQNKEWIKNHPERNREFKRKWARENRDKISLKDARRRSREFKLPATLTLKQWNKIKNDFGNMCCYCGKETKLTKDHFIAVTKGGELTINNIVPSCQCCNSSKRDKDFFKWYPQQEYYNKERENFILRYLGYKKEVQQLKII